MIEAMATMSPINQYRITLVGTEAARWRTCFEVLEDQHAELTVDDLGTLAPVVEAGLRSSLPTFQLGETGTGSHLLKMARKVGDDDYVEALRLFIREEQEHARLLALVCNALDIQMLDSHWTDGVFQTARRLFGLRAEILVLLVAEFVSLRFYEVLSEGVGDPTLANLFARIHADEQRHLEFHAATLPEHLDRWPSAIRNLAHAGWFTLVVGSAAVVAYDHRKVLKACGTSPLRFFRDVTTLLRAQHRRFFS